MAFSREEVLKITGGKLWQGELSGSLQGAAIDSREVKGGELFFPLPGEKADGHLFILEALQKGAAGSLLAKKWLPHFDTKTFPRGKAVIVVENVLQALHELAAGHRAKFALPVVAVTGSNGKTTTKDLIASVLSTRYNVLKTEANLNNHLGLPLMLLRLTPEHRIAVLELGMSGPGEIALLTALCRPERGVITNVGEAHLEFLGSQENIAEAKGELLAGLDAGGKAFLNSDDFYLRKMGKAFAGEVFSYGFEAGADLRALTDLHTATGCTFRTALHGRELADFSLPLPGRHNIYNALAATAVGLDFALSIESIREGLAGCTASAMRQEKFLTPSGIWVINDAYNANPTAMRFALQSLKEWAQNAYKIAVLGDMFELGPRAEEMHRAVGEHLAGLKIDFLLTVGPLAAFIARGAREGGMAPENIFLAGNHAAVLDCLDALHLPGSYILVKGSRGMQMEKIVEELLKRY